MCESFNQEIADMPIKINFIDNGVGIEFISSGIVTGKEIIEANKKVYTRENLSKLKYKIVDRTTCSNYSVTTEEIKIIANQDNEAAKINPNVLIALISTTPLQYGMSRMWEAYTDDIGFQVGIFIDRDSADNWLRTKLNITTHD
jgi:hypothetical protein